MTDRPSVPPSKIDRAIAAFNAITLPQALVVIAMIAGAVSALYLLPEEKLEWVKATIVGLLMLGTSGTLFLAPKPPSSSSGSSGGGAGGSGASPTSRPRTPVRIPPPSGDAARRADMVLVGIVLAVTVLGPLLSGCGGALAGQARAAAITTVALDGAHRMIVSTHEARSSACEDEACVLSVRESLRPVEVAHDAVRATLVAWVEALNIARLTGDSGDVLAAMVTAASRLLSEWHELAASFAGIGVELPELPDVVLLAGGAR